MESIQVGDKPYVIPPRPEAIIELSQLLNQEEPDIDKIVVALKNDVSLYAAVLGASNTRLFGSGAKITSPTQAVMRLGLQRLNTIVSVAGLKQTLSKAGRLERFWDTATEVAELTEQLAKQFSVGNPDEAYAVGMLHDCGIPLMLEAIPDYRDFLRASGGTDASLMCQQETALYGHDHFLLGSKIAKNWHLADSVCEAIEHQADFAQLLHEDSAWCDDSKSLLCILLLAKDISETYRRYWRTSESQTDDRNLKLALEYLGISDVEYMDIRDDHLSVLEQIS